MAVVIAVIAIASLYYLQPINENNTQIEEPKEPKPISNIKHANGEILNKTLTLPELFEHAKDSVVKISIRGIAQGIGSGFVYNEQGYIITNNHVIEGADKITVTFPDGISYNAELIGRDPFTDLAVIKVNADADKLKPLMLGDSSSLRVGEQVAAIGNPFGLSSSMTSGIISQLGRLLDVPNAGGFVIPDVIQTDAAINPGNSGGPLLNMRGEVIGVNTAILSRTGEFAGIGFAIPSNTVKKVVPALIEEGRYKHPWLGVSGSDLTPELAELMGLKEARGFLVMSVVKDSPADKAGIRGGDREVRIDGNLYAIGGDVIIGIDDREVRGISDILIYLQREKSVGDEVRLKIIRDNNIMEVTVILEERPNPFESP
ncbi:MAG: PDZ domain-containing protein [Candidatus Nitrosothermus koennekii]|nr:MAG: PDZ domain-containing protein [Candidatus Nitrosothermus koennekii]